MRINLLEEDEELNPMLSVINLIDLLLVFIVFLLIIIIKNPLNPFNTDEVTLLKDAGKPTMEMILKKGKKIERYQASGAIGQGEGRRAGIAYRMKDGSFIYVPVDH